MHKQIVKKKKNQIHPFGIWILLEQLIIIVDDGILLNSLRHCAPSRLRPKRISHVFFSIRAIIILCYISHKKKRQYCTCHIIKLFYIQSYNTSEYCRWRDCTSKLFTKMANEIFNIIFTRRLSAHTSAINIQWRIYVEWGADERLRRHVSDSWIFLFLTYYSYGRVFLTLSVGTIIIIKMLLLEKNITDC